MKLYELNSIAAESTHVSNRPYRLLSCIDTGDTAYAHTDWDIGGHKNRQPSKTKSGCLLQLSSTRFCEPLPPEGMPVVMSFSSARLPRGYDQALLYLDFDGVLHHENVLWHPQRGAYAGPPGFELFEHSALLASLLEPYPHLKIVLSTSWVRRYGCYGSAKRLPPALRERVLGATFHSKMNRDVFADMPRGQQVFEDVLRRKPRAWLALDDIDEGWPEEHRGNALITDEQLGIGAPGAAEAIRFHLERLAGFSRLR